MALKLLEGIRSELRSVTIGSAARFDTRGPVGTPAKATGRGGETELHRPLGKSAIRRDRRGIALSHFCYRRRKPLVWQGPRKLPKLAVAGAPTESQPRGLW